MTEKELSDFRKNFKDLGVDEFKKYVEDNFSTLAGVKIGLSKKLLEYKRTLDVKEIIKNNRDERLQFKTYDQRIKELIKNGEIKDDNKGKSRTDIFSLVLLKFSIVDPRKKDNFIITETVDINDLTWLDRVPDINLLEFLTNYPLPLGWEEVFKDAQAEFKLISNTLESKKEKHTITPTVGNYFRTFYLTKLEDVKVVFLAMDPYYQVVELKNLVKTFRAYGLCFANRKGETEMAKSIKVILKALQYDIKSDVKINHADLSEWGRQGVLLLNASLTAVVGKSGQLISLWNGFMDKVLKFILEKNKNTIFVMFGNDAQKQMLSLIGDRGIQIRMVHPAALGRYGSLEKDTRYKEFVNNRIFSKINNVLTKKLDKPAIDWYRPWK